MGDLASLHAQAKRLILQLREGLERLEKSEVRQLGSGVGEASAAPVPPPILITGAGTIVRTQRARSGVAQAAQ
jgi:hypothetical protein